MVNENQIISLKDVDRISFGRVDVKVAPKRSNVKKKLMPNCFPFAPFCSGRYDFMGNQQCDRNLECSTQS